ncbi:MAG: hypothetical protein JWP10_125, partial [Nocardioidaceae bacterium]|nr:hypothetical protein [Nocardioidaceae bacterium]
MVPANVSDYVRSRAASSPQGRALVEDAAKMPGITWAELDAAIDRLASALSGLGLVAGHRVGLAAVNSIGSVTAYFAIVRAGYVVVPINPRGYVSEAAHIITDSGLRVVLTDAVGVEVIRALKLGSDGPQVVVSGTKAKRGELAIADVLARASGVTPPSPTDPEVLAALPYTADASGNPRGVMLTHRALIANIEQVAAVEPTTMPPGAIVLGLLPIFHMYALNAILGQAARQGAKVVLVDGFDPDGVLDAIQREGVTNVPIAPPVIAAWAGRPDHSVKLAKVKNVLSGAA